MTHTYNLSGMTCTGCGAKVEKLLSGIEGVKSISIDLPKNEVLINMAKHIPVSQLKSALKDYPQYQLEEKHGVHPLQPSDKKETKSWLRTYKPVLIIFGYIAGVITLIQAGTGAFNGETWMQNFMAAFFLVFSFFKLLDIQGFADNYSTYDIIAKKWKGWGYVYAFIELGLGLAYLLKFNPLFTNALTFAVMSVSITGVLQSVLNKKQVTCACLGSVFNLPMSTVTILEDGLMIVMSLAAFITLL